ncbi:MAG TPA: hypothetical protein VFB22_07260 [Candidatus Baltobacteraceae bacterium]|nr:hypothetical protein [Candidatus Baltobacteraceae bacterium]
MILRGAAPKLLIALVALWTASGHDVALAYDAECHAPPRLLQSYGYPFTSEFVLIGDGRAIEPDGGVATTSSAFFDASVTFGKNNGGDGAAGLYLVPQTYRDVSSLLFAPLGLQSRAQASLLLIVRSSKAIVLQGPWSVVFTLPNPVRFETLRAFYSDDNRDDIVPALSVERTGPASFRAVFPPLSMRDCAVVVLTR